ncbi:MAG: hypothetical protein KJO08_07575 [Gammaproteobacteria bacterium]|nr:hypothetical protein [Gammaproteobacteria bacterium]NNJ83654.1 hypothetical protein [Gammaproteobacteria bacterium]
MPYSDFDLRKAKSAFDLTIVETEDLFSTTEEAEISSFLSESLKQNVPLALAIGTEKASSELIIMNVFLEIKRKLNISLFSGIEFTVDKEIGLSGFCDFIISRSPEQLFLDTPVIAVVEAKNEKIMAGMGQCVAEMMAAKIYNEKDGKPLPCVYGAVTTGHAWKFLRLEDDTVYIDIEDYYIKDPGKIIGILTSMMISK